MEFDLKNIVRENIINLVPYSSARSESDGYGGVFLDANENSFGSPIPQNYSRYPDPKQCAVKEKIATVNGITSDQIFVGNGSDEAIDLLIRVFCRPGIDNILICPPTYGMYEVAAAINEVAVRKVNLTREFALDTKVIVTSIDKNTRLIFLCTPNNPTGICLSASDILTISRSFNGIVVVDEAYIHFSDQPSLISEIDKLQNLVILQTFSKAWGLAGLRVGLAFADARIIDLLNKIKPPYNVSQVAQDLVLDALENLLAVKNTISEIRKERMRLSNGLQQLPYVKEVYPSQANFLLVRMGNHVGAIYRYLVDRGIIVRDRSNVVLCEMCLRITVGTPSENDLLLRTLGEYRAGSKLEI